jgi:hypothetical protein
LLREKKEIEKLDGFIDHRRSAVVDNDPISIWFESFYLHAKNITDLPPLCNKESYRQKIENTRLMEAISKTYKYKLNGWSHFE